MKEISVVIPCYNVEQYIDQCVESLVNQTFGIERMELIFVNDASTDSTLDKLAVWEQKYPDSIIVITLLENSKRGTARNIGMEYASGYYLGFIDSDDYVEYDMYERMYRFHKAHEVDCVVCGRYNERVVDGNLVRSITGPKQDGIMDLQNQKYRSHAIGLAAKSGVVQRLYKREWLLGLGVTFPENLMYEDNYFNGIVNYYFNRVGLISAPLYHYRYNESSTCHLRNTMHHLDRLKVELMKLEELMKRNLYDTYFQNIEFDFVYLYFVNTLAIMISRLDEIPEGIVHEMQRTVRTLFPNWRENELLKGEEDIMSACQMIDYPFEVGNKSEVQQVFNSLYKQNDT